MQRLRFASFQTARRRVALFKVEDFSSVDQKTPEDDGIPRSAVFAEVEFSVAEVSVASSLLAIRGVLDDFEAFEVSIAKTGNSEGLGRETPSPDARRGFLFESFGKGLRFEIWTLQKRRLLSTSEASAHGAFLG